MVFTNFKSICCAVALGCAVIPSYKSYAQVKAKHKKPEKILKAPVTLGLQSGRELLFNSSPLIHNRQSKVHSGINSGLVLRKPISEHVKVAIGFSYTSLPYTSINGVPTLTGNSLKTGFISAPIAGEYYITPEKCTVRPFVGAGLQYNFNIGSNTISPFNANTDAPALPNKPSKTQYISILFTQGVTFKVTPKIEINESIHFIPVSSTHIIGIDLGMGYKIP